MPCHTMNLPGGGSAIVCTPRGKQRRCRWCMRWHTKLCDAPKGKGTCDAPMCDDHATPDGPDRDLCPTHAPRKTP